MHIYIPSKIGFNCFSNNIRHIAPNSMKYRNIFILNKYFNTVYNFRDYSGIIC